MATDPWPIIHAEREALAIDLASLSDDQWATPSLCAGWSVRASDVDWSAGSGPEVHGPLASIILAITGRSAGLADLSGEGLATLTQRIQR